MPFPQLAMRWAVVAVGVVIAGLWQGRKLDPNLLGVAMLSATAITSIAALHPLTRSPGILGAAISWVRHFLSFAILTAAITTHPMSRVIMMGFGSTMLTLSAALC